MYSYFEVASALFSITVFLRIVATLSEVLEENKRRPGIVAAASKSGIRAHVCE